jgi:phosphoserine phosphatase
MLSRISQKIKNAKIFCFDVDSTVLANEGIDELAKYLNKYEDVAKITNHAMNGNMSFEKSLDIRLNLIKPTLNDISSFTKNNPPLLTNNIEKFMNILKNNDKIIYLVSGGFEPLIFPCADLLNIPYENVIANHFFHNPLSGAFVSYDKKRFTSKSGGKKNALTYIKDKHKDINPSIIMIGDGITDLEAKPPADLFIGYGGIVQRSIIKEKSDLYITDFDELSNIFKS